jgi:hypothetical protein
MVRKYKIKTKQYIVLDMNLLPQQPVSWQLPPPFSFGAPPVSEIEQISLYVNTLNHEKSLAFSFYVLSYVRIYTV